jgi:uncharacterized membrane protein
VILGWPEVQKTPADVLTVACDWTPFLVLTKGATAIVAHSVSVDSELLGGMGAGDFDFVTVGAAGVGAVDAGVSGLVHSVTLTAGMLYAYSMVALTATFNDAAGTILTRAFQVNVR